MGVLEELQGIVGTENVFSDKVECMAYSRDMSVHKGIPDYVVFAKSTDEVSEIMKLATRDRIPVVSQVQCFL
jgi:glycolate oxidase